MIVQLLICFRYSEDFQEDVTQCILFRIRFWNTVPEESRQLFKRKIEIISLFFFYLHRRIMRYNCIYKN